MQWVFSIIPEHHPGGCSHSLAVFKHLSMRLSASSYYLGFKALFLDTLQKDPWRPHEGKEIFTLHFVSVGSTVMLSCISWIADILALILTGFLFWLYPDVSDMIYAFTDKFISRQFTPLKHYYPSEKPPVLNIYKWIWSRDSQTWSFQRIHQLPPADSKSHWGGMTIWHAIPLHPFPMVNWE